MSTNYSTLCAVHLHSKMGITKHALIRYQALDKCFRNPGRMYFWEDLLEECNKALSEFDPESEGIQRRQLYYDINFMESEQGWSIPLGKYRFEKKFYYRYEDLSFSINNQPLNNMEAEQIKSALQIFSRFSGTPQFEWVNEMIPRLESKFGLVDRKKEVISFQSNLDLKGLHFIAPIFNAIINERVLNVSYKDFKSQESYPLTFHPYYLKQYNERWFAFGLNADKEISNWNLALDRIEALSETNLKYEKSERDWDEYFFDIIGVTRPEGISLEKIALLFSSDVAPYVITKPLHPTQKHRQLPEGLEVVIEVIPNFELERLIISFGDQVKVISPESLRKKISQQLTAAANQY